MINNLKILLDAVAIVLATTAQELSSLKVEGMGSLEMLKFAFDRFLIMFFASAALGSAIGFISALVMFYFLISNIVILMLFLQCFKFLNLQEVSQTVDPKFKN